MSIHSDSKNQVLLAFNRAQLIHWVEPEALTPLSLKATPHLSCSAPDLGSSSESEETSAGISFFTEFPARCSELGAAVYQMKFHSMLGCRSFVYVVIQTLCLRSRLMHVHPMVNLNFNFTVKSSSYLRRQSAKPVHSHATG